MAKKQKLSGETRGRYEFRVWGEHRKARKKLAKLASEKVVEDYDDCYLLVDDPSWNAKVRDNTLKIKQLIAEDKGFERWSSDKHRTAASTPSPFDDLFEELRLDKPQRGKKYSLEKAVAKLDPDLDVRVVFVSKHRERYLIDDIRAEVTDIEIRETGEVLRTLSFQGDDLPALIALRKQLGVRNEPNVAMHQVIEAEVASRS